MGTCLLIIIIGLALYFGVPALKRRVEEANRKEEERQEFERRQEEARLEQKRRDEETLKNRKKSERKKYNDTIDNGLITFWNASYALLKNANSIEYAISITRPRLMAVRTAWRDVSFKNEVQERPGICEALEREMKVIEQWQEDVSKWPDCLMFSESDYGKANRQFYARVKGMSRDYASKYLDEHELWMNAEFSAPPKPQMSKQHDDLAARNLAMRLYGSSGVVQTDMPDEKNIFDLTAEPRMKFDKEKAETLVAIIWVYAMGKPYSISDFNRACQIYQKYLRSRTVRDERFYADLFANHQIGGENAIKDSIKKYLYDERNNPIMHSPEKLETLASALMWMKAYDTEKIILEYMLSNDIQMPAKLQERLHSLNNGGGKAPSGFEVESDDQNLYFDVSSLAWRDEEYTGLFENLAFKETDLTYSLAIRDEDKSLMVGQSFSLADPKMVLEKIQEVFADEYGNAVVSMCKDCIALSGSGEEKISGILSQSKECEQLGVFVHIARIGKKLNIKFYTLFMPTSGDVTDQKQQALSMYKKLSPTVTMWEDGLKDTILMAIQQLLNDLPASDPTTGDFKAENGTVEF